MSRLPNTKTGLQRDIRGMREVVRDLEAVLNRRDADWDLLETLARDLEACASAFACNAMENLRATALEPGDDR